jgi:hypothetical protein
MRGQRDATVARQQSESRLETEEAYRASHGPLPSEPSELKLWISTPQGEFVPPNSTREVPYSISEPSTAGELPFTPTHFSRPHFPTAPAEPPVRSVALPSVSEFS